MTKRKHLKQIIRTRMEKTGERYAAARRHVVANAPPSAEYPFHFAGNIPATTALRSLLAAAKINDPTTGRAVTEETLFGLAGGIGIGVFAFLYEKADFASFFVGGRHLWQDDEAYLRGAFARLGVGVEVQETGSAKVAESHLRDAAAKGAPVIAWVDPEFLPHRSTGHGMNGGGYHVVVVHGLDAGHVLIGDLADAPIAIEASAFAAARAKVTKFKNRLMSISSGQDMTDLDHGASLRACYGGLNGDGAIGNARRRFSLDAIGDWASDLNGSGKRSWSHMFPRGKRLWSGLTMLYEFVELYGTGGGLSRPIFATYLSDLAERTSRKDLADLADGYNSVGQMWSDVAMAALPDGASMAADARSLLIERAELRTSAPEKVGEIARLNDAIEQLAQQAGSDFPLSDKQCAALLEDLATRAAAIHVKEVELHAALGVAAEVEAA